MVAVVVECMVSSCLVGMQWRRSVDMQGMALMRTVVVTWRAGVCFVGRTYSDRRSRLCSLVPSHQDKGADRIAARGPVRVNPLCRLRRVRVPGSAALAMLSSIRRGARGLPISSSAFCLRRVRQVDQQNGICVLTVVALSDSVLNPSPLCQI